MIWQAVQFGLLGRPRGPAVGKGSGTTLLIGRLSGWSVHDALDAERRAGLGEARRGERGAEDTMAETTTGG